jgi:hypothetical protein
VCTAALLLAASTVAAAGQDRPTARADIADMAWLAHVWTSDAGPMTIEEQWSAPGGGASRL